MGPISFPILIAELALNDSARTKDLFAKLGNAQIAVEISSVILGSPESLGRVDLALDPNPVRCRRNPARY
jgi:hypothetical protein